MKATATQSEPKIQSLESEGVYLKRQQVIIGPGWIAAIGTVATVTIPYLVFDPKNGTALAITGLTLLGLTTIAVIIRAVLLPKVLVKLDGEQIIEEYKGNARRIALTLIEDFSIVHGRFELNYIRIKLKGTAATLRYYPIRGYGQHLKDYYNFANMLSLYVGGLGAANQNETASDALRPLEQTETQPQSSTSNESRPSIATNKRPVKNWLLLILIWFIIVVFAIRYTVRAVDMIKHGDWYGWLIFAIVGGACLWYFVVPKVRNRSAKS